MKKSNGTAENVRARVMGTLLRFAEQEVSEEKKRRLENLNIAIKRFFSELEELDEKFKEAGVSSNITSWDKIADTIHAATGDNPWWRQDVKKGHTAKALRRVAKLK